MVFEKLTQISKPILWSSFLLGVLLSWSVLSGDNLGRVNLLYLIILYVIFPCFTLIYSFISYFYSPLQLGSFSTLIISVIQNNHFIFTKYKKEYLKLPQSDSLKLTLFYFSQLAAMSFSVASLLVLFILLITTDVHFIWRSTLLNSEHILNVLELIAIPWQFWQGAQPNLELISISQDNRLLNEVINQSNSLSVNLSSSNWWKFVLAAQLFYAFLTRFVVIMLLKTNFKMRWKKRNLAENKNLFDSKNNEKQNKTMSQLYKLSAKDISQNYAINNWANIPFPLLEDIRMSLTGQSDSIFNAGPSATDSERLIAERWRETQLIIVKSWEPPLAELSDFMQNSMGYILPLDIRNETVVEARDFHLQEWFRFVDKNTQWQVLLIPELSHKMIVNKPQ